MVLGFEDIAHRLQLLDEAGEKVGRSVVQDLQVDRPVAVDDAVSEPSWLRPRHVREAGLDVGVELRCGLAEDAEVPEKRIAALAIGSQRSEVRGGDERDCLPAASIISPSSRRSRRIEQAGLGQHFVAQALVERVAGDEIDTMAEELRQLVSEVLDVPAET